MTLEKACPSSPMYLYPLHRLFRKALPWPLPNPGQFPLPPEPALIFPSLKWLRFKQFV